MGKHGPPLGSNKKKTFIEVKAASTTYRATWGASTGYVGLNHVHHVVPCTSLKHSLEEYLQGKKPPYKQALAFFTKWDVNQKSNLMGLPIQQTYNIAFRVAKKLNLNRPAWEQGKKLLAWNNKMTPKYPVHLWKHADYNQKVYKDLNRVWTKLSFKEKNHKAVEGNDLAGDVQAVSDRYRGKLMAKNKQTRDDWENRVFDQFEMV